MAGQPTKYREDYVQQVYGLCLLGLTDAQIAEYFGVTTQTLNNWDHAHPAFFEAKKKAKELADVEVVESLRQKALAGDVTACIFWLKNRHPNKWRDRKEVQHGGAVDINHPDSGDKVPNRLSALLDKVREGGKN